MVKISYSTTLFAFAISMLHGCAGPPLPQGQYDPQAIANAAIDAFDKDNDGKLNAEELQACSSLQSASERVDVNQDEQLDAAEIADRVTSYEKMSDYIVSQVLVKRGARPVSDAKVQLSFSEFMGDLPTKFTTTTDPSGFGMPQSSPEKLLGFPPGFYDVEVVHRGKTWNFGVEMADDNPTVNQLEFDLRK